MDDGGSHLRLVDACAGSDFNIVFDDYVAGVLGNIKEGGKVFMGSPAIPYKDFFRSYAVFKKSGTK